MLVLLLAFLFSPQDKCTLSGTVVNAVTGEPLNKVSLTLEGGPGAAPSAMTDAKGHFTLVDLPPAHYNLKGQRNGFLDGYYGARRAEGNGIPIAFEAGQEVHDLVLKLTPFGVISGTIRDPDGEPLALITVTAHRVRYRNGRREIVKEGGAYTDDLGQYRIPNLAPGKYYVHAESRKASEFGSNGDPEPETEDHSAKGSDPPKVLLPALYPGVQEVSAARAIDVGPGARVTGVDIALTRSSTVSVKGRATTPPGMVLADLRLKDSGSESDELGVSRRGTIGKNGEFEFRGVPPGNYTLTATAQPPSKPFNGTMEMFPQRLRAHVPVSVGTTPVQKVAATVYAGADIAGRVTMADGEKLALGGFSMIGFSDDQGDSTTALVTSDGHFNASLAPGHYTILSGHMAGGDAVVRKIETQGRNVMDEGLTVAQPGKMELEIVLGHDGAKLDGVALGGDDQPAAGATVVLVPEGKRRSQADLYEQAETDQYGRFSFEDIAPGDYKVFAWDDVEPGMWWDAEFLKKYEAQGQSVSIAAKAQSAVKVHLAKE